MEVYLDDDEKGSPDDGVFHHEILGLAKRTPHLVHIHLLFWGTNSVDKLAGFAQPLSYQEGEEAQRSYDRASPARFGIFGVFYRYWQGHLLRGLYLSSYTHLIDDVDPAISRLYLIPQTSKRFSTNIDVNHAELHSHPTT